MEHYTASLAAAQEIGRTDLIADALYNMSVMALRQGRPQQALALTEQSLPMWEAIHDQVGLASALVVMARAVTLRGDYDQARALLDKAEAVFHDTGYFGADHLLALLRGNVEFALGQVAAAQRLYERTVSLAATGSDPTIITLGQRGLACCALRQADLPGARAAIDACLRTCEAAHERWIRALLEFAEGQLAWMGGDLSAAGQHYRSGLRQALALGDQCAIAEALEQWAIIQVSAGGAAQAAQLFGAAAILRREAGAPLPPIDRPAVERGIAEASNLLERASFENAWAWGEECASRGLEQAVALALNDR
jgi:tetratricopeptide (TPR) repeat protein